MGGKRISLFRLFGFKIQLDLSWLILGALVAWSLAVGFFPNQSPGYSSQVYWLMGIGGALGLFFSILLHETAHAAVARHYGVNTQSITLFLFGGVAEMEDEPNTPKAELLMALAGPATSLVLGALLLGTVLSLQWAGVATVGLGVPYYLGIINILLGLFNMIPAFPMDGGRVLRAILWRARKDLRWATQVTSRLGGAFGLLLILWGGWDVLFNGNFIGGLWKVLIGMFIRGAAAMSYKQLLMKEALTGEPVERLMKSPNLTVPADLRITDLVERYFFQTAEEEFPVTQSHGPGPIGDGTEIIGTISLDAVKEHPRDEWNTARVRDWMLPITSESAIEPQADTMDALNRMNRKNTSRLMVVRNGQVVGTLARKDIMRFMDMKLSLESAS